MSTSASASMISSMSVSLATSSACSSNSSLTGSSSSDFFLPNFLLPEALTPFVGSFFSSLTGQIFDNKEDLKENLIKRNGKICNIMCLVYHNRECLSIQVQFKHKKA